MKRAKVEKNKKLIRNDLTILESTSEVSAVCSVSLSSKLHCRWAGYAEGIVGNIACL